MLRSRNFLAFAVVVGMLATSMGCSILATAMWVIDPNDIEPEFGDLVGKRVVVVCQPNSALTVQNYGVANELTMRISQQLKQNVKEIDVVSQADLRDWTDHNELSSYEELGKAMNADLVVAIDLSHFETHKGKTMLQGNATADVAIYDVEAGDIVYQLAAIDSQYPPDGGIPVEISNRNFEQQFRRRYVSVLAHQIARRFHPHDSRADLKIDRFYKE